MEEKNISNRTNDEDERVNDLVLIIRTIFPHICSSQEGKSVCGI